MIVTRTIDAPTAVVLKTAATSCRRRVPWMVFLWLSAAAWLQEPTAQSLTYPATHRDSVVDNYHGTKVADPYRWLEQLDSPSTADWVKAQSRLTIDYFWRLPEREAVRERLTALWNYSRTEVPWREAGRLFYAENSGLQNQPVLYAQNTLHEAPRLVLDPQDISPDGAIAVHDFAVSPDGRWVAYSTSPGGADAGETRVLELSTGRALDDVVRGTWGTVCWTYDGGGFFYMHPTVPKPGQAAQKCERPILLRVASDASHSYASEAEAIAELSHMWAFIAARLGVPVVRAR